MKTSKKSEISDDDLADLWAEDQESPPVQSVVKTRIKDNKDIDFEKVLPYQNYFFNKDLRAAMKQDSDSVLSTPKRMCRALDPGLESRNDKVKISKKLEFKKVSNNPGIKKKHLFPVAPKPAEQAKLNTE